MEIVTIYRAKDGREFMSAEECTTYEDNTQAVLTKVNEHKGNPSEALIALMTGVQDILGISLVSYDGYVKLFGEHRPCAYACSLWRVLSDYSHDYPTIFAMYGEIMNDYIALYGEPSF